MMIDMSNSTTAAAGMLAGQMGITQPSLTDEVYMFPIVMKSSDGIVYMLQGVDDQAGSGTIGENVYNSIVNDSTFSMTGTRARYARVDASTMSDALTPYGFSEEEIGKFKSMTGNLSEAFMEEEIDEAPFELEEQTQLPPVQINDR